MFSITKSNVRTSLSLGRPELFSISKQNWKINLQTVTVTNSSYKHSLFIILYLRNLALVDKNIEILKNIDTFNFRVVHVQRFGWKSKQKYKSSARNPKIQFYRRYRVSIASTSKFVTVCHDCRKLIRFQVGVEAFESPEVIETFQIFTLSIFSTLFRSRASLLSTRKFASVSIFRHQSRTV